MDEYKKYLADRLLSEEQPITYRLLSRALDVHVNTAKEMLYDYHTYQNAEKPDSIFATYLLSGIKKKAQDDGDVQMSSSMPDQEEEVPATTVTLVGQDKLQDTLATYQDVTSIHVYSLAPNPQRDLLLLSDLSRALAEYTAKEQNTKKYGTIANPYVRRRERHARPVAAAPAKPQPAKPVKTEAPPAIKSETSSTKPEPPKKTNPFAAAAANKAKQEAGATDSAKSSKESTPAPSASKPAPAPASKKGGIMQSFAKAASKPPKPKAEVKKEEDTAMALSDDGEADDDDQDIISSKKKAADSENDTGRKSRKQREEELRRMMEEEDEEENDEEEKEEVDPADQEMAEAPEPEPEPEPETKEKQAEEPQEVSKTENGRRRGKRRVMKKKRTIDEKGYMVTTQEAAWESFSEDEAPPPAKKATPAPSSAAVKPKKAPAKAGQGNIMSFFSKK